MDHSLYIYSRNLRSNFDLLKREKVGEKFTARLCFHILRILVLINNLDRKKHHFEFLKEMEVPKVGCSVTKARKTAGYTRVTPVFNFPSKVVCFCHITLILNFTSFRYLHSSTFPGNKDQNSAI